MNIFAIFGLIIGIAGLGEAFVMFIKGRRLAHYLWGMLCLCVALWGFGSYKIATTLDPTKAILWWRLAYAGVIFIPVFLVHFLYEFLEIRRKIAPKIFYALGFFFLFINSMSSLFISEARFVFDQFYYIDAPSLFYIFFVAVFFGAVLHTLAKLGKALRTVRGIKRDQLKYMFIALCIGFSGGGTSFLPVFHLDIYPVLNISISLGIFVVAYAIIKHRLMDIRIVIKQGTVYLMSLIVVVGMAVIGVWGIARAAEQIISSWIFIGGALAVAFGLLVFEPIKQGFQKLANKYLFVSLFNYQEAVRSLSRQLTANIDLQAIIDSIIKIAMEMMKLDKAGILLRNQKTGAYQIQKILGFQEENGISLVRDNFLTNYLQKTKKPIVYEELSLQIRDPDQTELKSQLEKLKENMRRIEAALCLPLLREETIQGVIVLGSKISGDAYSAQDLELLETLSHQASIAIENGLLYKEVQDLTLHLQDKVEAQTQHIKKLFETKTEFLHLVSHQLRTPLTALRGLLSMWAEGNFDDYPSQEKQEIKKRIFLSCERLNNITNDMLDTLDVEQGYASFKFETVNLIEIIEETLSLLQPNFDKKGLYVKVIKPDKPLLDIQADKQYLLQAFQNIIDNAEKYTKQGGLTITLSQASANQVQVSFKDTGIGLVKQERRHLFRDKFFRGKRADKVYTAGSGLGLYIVKHIIEGHHGSIEVRSRGENQGTEFIITLPVRQVKQK